MSVKVSINGARGRMGLAVKQAAQNHPDLQVIAEAGSGDDIRKLLTEANVVIDFSVAEATLPLVRAAVEAGKPLIIGTTGHSESERSEIEELARRVPTVWAGNFSVGVNLLFFLTEQAAGVLELGFDAEIIEMHHRMKKDSPSGTAERLLEILLEARNLTRSQVRHGRQGLVGARPETEIGMHAVRGGDVVGDHTVIFAGTGERLELTHKASTRAVFAEGALRAALWVVDQKPGIYDMQDVLGLRR